MPKHGWEAIPISEIAAVVQKFGKHGRPALPRCSLYASQQFSTTPNGHPGLVETQHEGWTCGRDARLPANICCAYGHHRNSARRLTCCCFRRLTHEFGYRRKRASRTDRGVMGRSPFAEERTPFDRWPLCPASPQARRAARSFSERVQAAFKTEATSACADFSQVNESAQILLLRL